MKTHFAPEGYHTVNPYLSISGVERVIDFLKKTFEATASNIHRAPDGRIMNAEVTIGDSMILMGEIPAGQKPFPGMLYLYVENADDCYQKAMLAGGVSVEVPGDQAYGDRRCAVEDSAGNQWWIATRLKK